MMFKKSIKLEILYQGLSKIIRKFENLKETFPSRLTNCLCGSFSILLYEQS